MQGKAPNYRISMTQYNQNNDGLQAKKAEQAPNAYRIHGSRFLKRQERNARMFKTLCYEDYLFGMSDQDLVKKFEGQYRLEAIFEPLAEMPQNVKELSTFQSWKNEEFLEKTRELLRACTNSGLLVKDAASANDPFIRSLDTQCENLRDELKGLNEQMARIQQQDHSTNPSHNLGWGDPVEFREELPAVKPFSPDFLPEPLRPFVVDAAERIQCPPDFIAAGVIVVFSAIVGAGCSIRPLKGNNWSVVPNLWGGLVGSPGAKKTPALNECMSLLAPLENEADEEHARLQMQASVEQAEWDIRQSEAKGRLKDAVQAESEGRIDAAKSALLGLEEEKAKSRPKWRRYKTNDATTEKLEELLADNPRGLLLFRDEIIGFLSNLDKEGREDSRAFFLEAWAGFAASSVKSDRIKRGTTCCNPCVSVLGGIQPSKLRRYLQGALENLENDGFVQRFQVLVFPDKPKTWALIERARNKEAFERAARIAKNLVSMNFTDCGAIVDEHHPLPFFRFNIEAQKLFNTWLEALELRILRETDDSVFLEHLAKYRSLMPSLAVLFHLIRIADGDTMSEISLQDVESAIALCDYLESHAQRIYALGEEKAIFSAKALLKKIRQGKLGDGFCHRDVYRKNWGGLSKPSDVEDACKELIACGWIKEEFGLPNPRGGPTPMIYRLHPLLLGSPAPPTDKTDE